MTKPAAVRIPAGKPRQPDAAEDNGAGFVKPKMTLRQHGEAIAQQERDAALTDIDYSDNLSHGTISKSPMI